MRWATYPRSSFRAFVVALALACGAQVALGQKGDDDSGYRPAPSANVEGDVQALPIDAPAGSKVVVIAIDRTVELGLAAFVRRAIADNPDAAAIILDVNTLGGRVDAGAVEAALRPLRSVLAAEGLVVALCLLGWLIVRLTRREAETSDS